MEQWVKRISEFFNIQEKNIGRIGGGKKKRTGQIDVAVIQSVCRKGVVEDWVKEYGQVIVDECHHISAFSFEQVVRSCGAKFKLGLSATLTRKDGQHPIVLMNLGPLRYRVNAKKQAAERPFEHIVQVKNTHFEFESLQIGRVDINEIFRKLYTDENRNSLITNDIIDASHNARQILVLSERTEHLEILKQSLHGKIENLFVLRG